MAVYKVIQDIEAEDKLLGPLTLKGFIYAAIAGVLAFINVRLLITPELGVLRWLLILLFAMPMILFGVLASPLGRDQPTEVWLLSHVRFLLKPRKRLWNQSGISQLVTITVPKKIERHLTKGLNQSEVKSRLQALTMTLDSHGWVVKSSAINLSPSPQFIQHSQNQSDRLVDASALPQNLPIVDIHPADDIMDEQNNPTAQKFEQLVKQADVERKQGILNTLKSLIDDDEDKSKKVHFMDPDTQRVIASRQRELADKDKADRALEKRLQQANESLARLHHQPKPQMRDANAAAKNTPQTQAAPVTAVQQAANIELAQSGSDFKVSTLQKLANRQGVIRQIGPNEVEISLH